MTRPLSRLSKRVAAEFFGTFALVFAGTGAIIVNDLGGAVTHVGVALTFGLVVMAMIYSLGEMSGAHFNPAVSFGFWLSRRFSSVDLLAYIVTQAAAAVTASAVLRFLFATHDTLGATIPSGTATQSFVLEAITTFFLVFVILNVATGSREQGLLAGAAIGAIVSVDALFAGPISGASMNPARSLGPALISHHLQFLWIYLTAPFVGSAVAVAGHAAVARNPQPSRPEPV